MAQQIPLVDYLVLGDDPHLVANECTSCGARFFDRRNACAACEATEFKTVDGADDGEVRTFTIVSFAAPGIPVPFVAAVVDCDGTSVRANLINVTPDPEHVTLGHEGPPGHRSDRHGRQRHRSGRLRVRTPGRLGTMASASEDLWILGIHMTKFGKHPDKDIVDLAAEAGTGALADGGVTMKDIGVIGAGNLMGHGAHRPAAPEAARPDRHPRLQRVQRLRHRRHRAAGGLHGGQGGRGRHGPGRRRREAGRRRPPGRREPRRDSNTWTPQGRYGAVAPVDGRIGTETMPGVFAQIGMEYGHRYGGTSFELFAKISEKNHAHSTLNPLAAYTKKMTLDEIMNDVMIAYPNTAARCARPTATARPPPWSSAGSKLKTLSLEQQRRAVKISASILTTDPWEEACQVLPNVNDLTRNAADPGLRAGRRRARGSRPGRAARLLRHRRARALRQPRAVRARAARSTSSTSGATWRDGKTPVNVSGGLESKGHPIAATGIANVWEVATHLRGEAGDRQIEGAKVGLTHVIGLGSACGVHILEKSAA